MDSDQRAADLLYIRTFAIIFVKAGTLDDVSDLKPTTHYWVQSAQTWVPLLGDAELVQQE